MMVELPHGGEVYIVYWRYGWTQWRGPQLSHSVGCLIDRIGGYACERIGAGLALCRAGDSYDKELGRKLSLARALKDAEFGRSERKEFWQAYFARKPLREGVEGLMRYDTITFGCDRPGCAYAESVEPEELTAEGIPTGWVREPDGKDKCWRCVDEEEEMMKRMTEGMAV